jgi:hypothetical protein
MTSNHKEGENIEEINKVVESIDILSCVQTILQRGCECHVRHLLVFDNSGNDHFSEIGFNKKHV